MGSQGSSLLVVAVADSGGGTPWPVVIIGGLIVLAGLVAVRTEFRSWRERRNLR